MTLTDIRLCHSAVNLRALSMEKESSRKGKNGEKKRVEGGNTVSGFTALAF